MKRPGRLLFGVVLAVCGGIALADELLLQALPPPARVNAAQAELGRHLFFEPRLSGDGSRSCASCHVPEKGFADGEPLARGYHGTEYFRNTPGLLSVRLKARLMWDGRRDGRDLAGAVREMALDAQFMNGNARVIAERIRQIPQLAALSRKAFGTQNAGQDTQAFTAIAEFLKTLDHGEAAFDRALRGAAPLPAAAARGMQLFMGKAGCVQCHSGPLFSDGRAHRLGVTDAAQLTSEPLRAVSLLRYYKEQGLPRPEREHGDVGVFAVSKNAADRGRFITPSLRGLDRSGPYLHNGRLARLEDVLDFHARGGGPGSELAPVTLDEGERQALLAFLRALSAPPSPVLPPPAYDYGVLPREGE